MSTNAHVCSTCSCAFSILFLKAFNSLITPARGPGYCVSKHNHNAYTIYSLQKTGTPTTVILTTDIMRKVIQNKGVYTYIIKKVSTPFVISTRDIGT